MSKAGSIRVVACLGLLACFGLCTALGQQPGQSAAGQKVKHVVYDVKHGAARDLAELLGKLYKAEPAVQALPAPVRNALVLSAPANTMDEMLDLLKRLDRRPRLVEVEVLVAEVQPLKGESGKPALPVNELDEREFTGSAAAVIAKLQELRTKGLLGELRRFRLTTAENQRGSLQIGESRPYTTGVAGGLGKGGPRSFLYRNVGTIVRTTPQFGEGNKIILDLHLSEARMRRPEDGVVVGAENGQPVRATEFIHTTFEGKVTVASGEAVAVTGVRTQSTSGRHQTLVIVTARQQEVESKAGR
jgi:type II secretory pathway component GspD/PulD (secretin)